MHKSKSATVEWPCLRFTYFCASCDCTGLLKAHNSSLQRAALGLEQYAEMPVCCVVAGCIYGNESTMVTILDSNFTTNAGLAAGAVALWNSTASVNNTYFYNNTCNSQGAATCPALKVWHLPPADDES